MHIKSSASVIGSQCALKRLVSIESDLTAVIQRALLKCHRYLIVYHKLTNWHSTTTSAKLHVRSATLISVAIQENS